MARQFGDVLRELAGGSTFEQLTTELTEVVVAVKETGSAGKLTLTLDIKPNGAHGVEVSDKITTKIPKEDRGSTLFFTDAEGSLHRRDPRQQKLPLRQVGVEDHDPETGEVHG